MSFGTNGLDRVCSLQKIPTQLHLENLCVNGTSSSHLADFRVVTKQCDITQNMTFGSNGVDQVRSLRKILTQLRLGNLCVIGTCSASFAPTLVQ
jgi:hypothetical protein